MPLSPKPLERNWAGLMVPAVLVLGLFADGLSRFMSIDRLSIRAWEAMTRNAFPEVGIPFEPEKHYENDRTFGDLAAKSNRRELREYHREVFTSDRFGYRNLDGFSRERPPDAILVGTSFSVGCGVSDDETLAVRLGARTGQRIYNGAGATASPVQVGAIARRFGLQHGTVFYELLEASGLPKRPGPLPLAKRICFDRLGLACLHLKGWKLVSPLEIASRRAHRWLEDDVWLPNTLASGAVPSSVGGAPMLFGEQGVLACPEVTAEDARDYFRWFRDGIDGLDLFVILVPSKFTAYGALIDLRGEAPDDNGAKSCLITMSRALEDLGIPYVNLTDPLQKAARDALARRELLYFRGDTHWNAAGIDVAAQIIGQAWSSSDHGGVRRGP